MRRPAIESTESLLGYTILVTKNSKTIERNLRHLLSVGMLNLKFWMDLTFNP